MAGEKNGSSEACVEVTAEQSIPSRPTATLLPIWVFLGLSAALSWTGWFLPNSNRALYVSVGEWRVTFPLANLKLLVGNCLPGVLALVWVSAEGKHRLHYLLSSLVAWKV